MVHPSLLLLVLFRPVFLDQLRLDPLQFALGQDAQQLPAQIQGLKDGTVLIGALCHIAHGRTNSILLPYVIRYNGAVPEEPTSWPKYNKYVAPERYQEIAKNLGVNPGKTPEEGVENLAKAVEDYRDNKLGMNKSFQECGVDEDYYWSIIDQIGMRAYEDQCAPANPRIPQIEDMKDIAIAAYYGVSQEEGHKLRVQRQGEAATEEASERA